MSVTTEGEGTRGMTLAFGLSAFERLAEPNEVIDDAREWSRYVGVIANDTDAVASFVEEHDLRQDFDLGDRDKWLALEGIREGTDTDRHVFVGLTEDDRLAAEGTGWEFVPLHEAAEKAGWTLAEERKREPGLVERVRTRLRATTLWPGGGR